MCAGVNNCTVGEVTWGEYCKSKAFLAPLSISNLFNISQVLHVEDHGNLNSLSV
jgi:hypothetical protein